jgi:hypothetical protein
MAPAKSAASTPPRTLSGRELLVVVVGLAALTLVEIWVTGTQGVLTHPMWLDECVTSLILNDPSFRHMLSAIHGGVETNGPAFYLVGWPIVHALGHDTPPWLRAITAGMMVAALVGVYATCRRVVSPDRAAIGTLVVAAHPAVVVQMWQTRMYGFWLAAAAWYCAYTVFASSRQSRLATTTGGLLAVLVVTSHWLGVFVLLLVAVPAMLLTRRDRRELWVHALPLVVGVLALGLCVPLILSQRRILTIPTWIDPVSIASIARALRWIFIVPPLIVVVAYVLLRARAAWALRNWLSSLRPVLPVLALLLLPLALIGMSLALQPVLIERYMLPTVIPLGVLASLVALPARRRLGAMSAALASVALAVIGALELKGLRAATREDDARFARVIEISERVTAANRDPLVFVRRFEAYPLIQARPQLAGSVTLLDFAGTDSALMHRTVFERDLARAVARYYGQYRLTSSDEVRQWKRFVVITNSSEQDELYRLLPGFKLSVLGVDEYLAEAP